MTTIVGDSLAGGRAAGRGCSGAAPKARVLAVRYLEGTACELAGMKGASLGPVLGGR